MRGRIQFERPVSSKSISNSPLIINLCFDGGVDSIQLFKELFAQPKLDIFRVPKGHVDTPVS